MKSSGPPSFFKLCLLTLMFVSYTDAFVIGAPRGSHVVSGTASFTQDGNLTVVTAGNRSVINYTSFDIGKNETVQFVQPGATATVLNRVTSADPTNIFGQLQANGIVIIVNPYGVFFQNGSVVNVGGLIAAAGNVSDADFTTGKIHFTDLSGDVRNDGVIAADNRIALMGANVVNTGSLTAAHGMAMLVSGADVYVGERHGNIFVQANGRAVQAASATGSASAGSVTNRGTVAAPRVLLGAGDLYSTAIVNSGLLQGRRVAVNAGPNGSATVGGTLDAASKTAAGGHINVLGGTVTLQGATLDASGAAGGGSVRVGGDFHGAGTLATSTMTTVDAATTIKADASGATGDGGTVVLWSDAQTSFGGSISARGGSAGGNGGSVEVSSRDVLAYRGLTDLSAPAGFRGTLLLDPDDIVIDTGGTDIVPVAAGTPPTSTVPFGSKGSGTETLEPGTLETALSLANVVLDANNDIVFRVGIAPTVALPLTNNLTLDAGHSIYIGDPGTVGTGAATVATLVTGGNITAKYNSTDGNGTTATTAPTFAMTAGSALTTTGAVAITDGGLLAATGGATVGAITAPGGILVDNHLATTGDLTVNGALSSTPGAANTAGGAITLTTSGTLTVAGSIASAGTGTGAGGPVSLAASGAAGSFAFSGTINSGTGGTAITSAGALSLGVAADNPSLTDVSLANVSAGGGITLSSTGSNNGISLAATDAATFAGNLTFDSAAGITLGAGAATFTGNVALNAPAGNIVFGAGGASFGANLALGTGSADTVTQSGALTVTGTLSGGATIGAVTLANSGNSVAGLGGFNTGNQAFKLTDAYPTSTGLTLSGDLNAGTGAVTLSNTGAVVQQTGGTIEGGVTSITGAGLTLVSVTTSGATQLSAGSGALALQQVSTTGAANAGSALSLAGNTFSFTGGANSINSGTAATTVTASGALSLGAAADTPSITDASVNAITAGGGLVLQSTNAALTVYNPAVTNTGAITLQPVGTTAGNIVLAGSPGFAGPLTFSGSTSLSTNSTVTDSGTGSNGNVTFTGGVDGASSLTLSTVGTQTFGGAVGGTTPLTSLTSGTGPVNLNGGAVTTNGTAGQVYNGAVTLGADTTLTTGTGGVTFGSTVDGGYGLTVDAGGLTTFANNVGGTTALTGLSVSGVGGTSFTPTTASGLTSLAVTTSGATGQSYNAGTLTLGVATSLTANGGGAVSLGAVTGGGFDLTVTAADGATAGAITGAGALDFNGAGATSLTGAITATSLTVTGGTGVTLSAGGTAVTTTDEQNYDEALTLGADTTLVGQGTAANGGIALRFGSTVGGAFSLTLANTASGVAGVGSDTVFDGAVGTLTGLSTSAVGTTDLNGGAVTTSGSAGQVYAGPVVLGAAAATAGSPAATTLTANGGGPINFASSLGGSVATGAATQALTVDTVAATTPAMATPGIITFGGSVGATSTAATALASLTTSAGSPVDLDGGAVTTTGDQTYGGTVTLGSTAATPLTTLSGATLTAGVLIDGGNTQSLTLSFTNPVTLAGGTAAAAGFVTLNGIDSLVSSGSGGTQLSGSLTTAGSQDFTDTVTLLANTTLTSTNSTVTAGTVNAGSFNLEVDADGSSFGTITNGGGLTFQDGSDAATFTGNVTAASLDSTGAGGVTFSAPLTVSTTGAQTYVGPLALGGDTTLASSGGTIMAGPVTGNGDALTVTASTGSTFGAITGAGALLFNGAGTSTLNGAISATSLTVTGGTGATLGAGNNGGTTNTVQTSAGQTYGETLTLAANTTLADTNGGDITLAAVNSDAAATARALTVNTGGTTTFGGIVGATALASLTVGAAGANPAGTADIDTTSITTTGAQTYNDKVVVGPGPAATTQTPLTATLTVNPGSTASITFNNTVDASATGVQGLTVNSPGNEVFNMSVGATTPLASLTTDGNGSPGGDAIFAATAPATATSVTTTGLQSYHDAVLLQTDTTLAAGSLALGSSIDGKATATTGHNLTLTIGSAITLSGGTSVGKAAPGVLNDINNFVANGSGSVGFNGNFETYGSQTYANQTAANGPLFSAQVYLTGSRTFSSDNNAAVTFGPVDSAATGTYGGLAVLTGGATTFTGPLGGANPLGSVTVTGPGGTTVFGYAGAGNAVQTVDDGVTSTGAQTYNNAVTLTHDTTLQSRPAGTATAGGGISFNTGAATVNGPYALTLDTTGATRFGGLVGNTAPLASLTVVAGSAAGTTVSATAINTTGAQTYGSPLVLGSNLTLTTTAADPAGGAITFNAAVGGSGYNLTTATAVNGGNTVFGVNSGAAGAPLNNLVTSVNGETIFEGPSFTTAGDQTYQNPVVLQSVASPVVSGLTLASTGGSIDFEKTLTAAGPVARDLTVTTGTATGESVTFGGAVGGATDVADAASLNSLAVTSPAIKIDGGIVNTASTVPRTVPDAAGDGVQTYNGSVLLGQSTTFVGTTVVATGGVNAQNHDLTLTLSGVVTVPFGNFTNIDNFTSNGPGGTAIAGGFTTAGFQHYENAVTLTGNATLVAGTVAGQDSLRFDATLASPGGYALTLDTGGPVVFAGVVGGTVNAVAGPLGSLTTTGGGENFVNGGAVTTTGGQTYGGPVVLGAATGQTTFTSNNGGTISFGTAATPETVDGSVAGVQALTTSTSGAVFYYGAVGVTPLASLTALGTGTTNINGGSVTTTGGGQSYNGPVEFNTAAATTLSDTTTGNLFFGATVNNSVAGTPADSFSTGGNLTFKGAVGNAGPLGDLTASAGGAIFVNGGLVKTTGSQTYGTLGPAALGTVSLGNTTTFNSTGGGAVTFDATVDGLAKGAQALAVDTAGNTIFNGLVGNVFPLASLTTDAGGQTQFNMAIGAAAAGVNVTGDVTVGDAVRFAATGSTPAHPTVLTGGSQAYNGGGSATQSTSLGGGGTLTSAGTLDFGGVNDLNVRFGGLVTLPGAFVNVRNFVTDGTGGTLVNGAFTTVGTQTYSDRVTLAGTPILTGGGSLVFDDPVDGNAPLTLDATGPGAQVMFNLNALVGNTTPVGALTISSASGTVFGMDAGAAAIGANRGGVNAASLTINQGPVFFDVLNVTPAHPGILTTGAQTYATAATLQADTSLVSSGGGAIDFSLAAATIDSAAGTLHALSTGTTGTQTFTGLIGSMDPLAGLTTGTGATVFGMTIPTSGTAAAGVVVAGPVATAGPTTFDVANSRLTLPSVLTLGGGAQSYGGVVTLAAPVTVLNSADTEPAAGTFNGGGTITFGGNIVSGVAVNSTAGTPELDVRAGVGTAEFDGPVTTTGDFSPGGASVVFKGSVGPLGTFTVEPNNGGVGTGLIDLNGGLYTVGGLALFSLPTVLSANTTLQAANVTFASTLDGSNLLTNQPYALTINVNGGTIAFQGVVGGTVPLASLTTGSLGTAVGTTRFEMPLPAAGSSLGGVNVLNAVAINTNADFETTGGAVPTVLSGVTYRGVAGTGTQTYGAAVTLGQNTVLQDVAAAGSITFNGRINARVDGGAGLSVNSNGDEVFNQLVGDQFTLASLSTDDVSGGTGAARFNLDLTPPGTVAGVRVAGAVDINDRAVFNATGGATLPTILSGGAQTYALAATVTRGTVLTAGSGNIDFAGAVDGVTGAPQALTVNTPGNEIFGGLVGAAAPLASLTTDATGPATGQAQFVMTLSPAGLAAGVGGVNTTGGVTINDAVLFRVAGTVGLPSNHPGVVSGGTQTYQGAATLGGPTILTSSGGSIVFGSTLDSDGLATPQSLVTNTLSAGGSATFAAAVGGTFPLASLTTNGSGTTRIDGGSIVTTGSQEYFQSVALGGNTVLRTLDAGGNIDFHASLDGTYNLMVNADAASFVAVGGTVPLLNLTVTAPSGIDFNYTPALVTAGQAGVNLAGALTLNSPASFNAAGDGNVVFVRTGVAVAGGNPASAQDYYGAVLLSGGATFTDLQSGGITFHQTVDGATALAPSNLTVSTGGAISFLGPVGAATPLTGLTTSNLGLASGRTILDGGSVTTTNPGVPGSTGAQTYNDPVMLGTAAVLTSTASGPATTGGPIVFAATVDSGAGAAPAALTVNTSGATVFGGLVGATNALASVTTDNEGARDQGTLISGGGVTTTGAQTYNDPVFLGATTTLASTAGGDIAFHLTLDSNTAATPEALTVNTGGRTVFRGAVGATNALASVTTDNEGAGDQGTLINGGSVTTTGAQTYHDPVTLGTAATLASTAAGNVTFAATVDSDAGATPAALTVNTGGATVFGGLVGATNALASVTTDNEGARDQGTLINGGGVTTTGAQTYNDAVTLGGGAVLASTAAGPLVFNSTVNGAFALTLDTGGQTIFNRPVGNLAPLAALTTDNAGAAGEETQFNMAVGPAAGVVVNGPVTINDAVRFNVTGSSLTLPGILTLGNSNQTYHGPATLGTSTFLTTAAALPPAGGAFTGGGSINFNSTGGIVSSGGTSLFVRAGVGTDSISAAVAVGSVDLGGAAAAFRGPVTLPGTLSIEPNDHTGGGSVAFGGPSLTTTGAQTYNVAFVLAGNTILTSTGGGNITFASTVDGGYALTLDTTGSEVFENRVGGLTPLASLTTNDPGLIQGGGQVVFAFAGGTTAAPSVTTTGAQSYHDAVILRADTVLASTGGGRLLFAATVDSDAAATPRALTLNTSGNEVFDGQVGAGAALASLTTDDPAANTPGGQVIFDVASGAPSVTTTGAQSYHDAAALQANTVLTSTGGGGLSLGAAVDGAFALTLSTGGQTTLAGAVGAGGGPALASLTTTGGGAVVLAGGAVTTSGLQSYGGAVVLGADTVLTSTLASGGLSFAATVDSDAGATPRALTLNAAGDETFNGRVGGTVALASLTTDDPASGVTGGHVVFNIASSGGSGAPSVTTTGAQSYHDAAQLRADTILTSTDNGRLDFASTVDNSNAADPHALTLNTGGDVVFGGLVGAGKAIGNLTTNAGGQTAFSMDLTGQRSGVAGVNVVGAVTINNAVLFDAPGAGPLNATVQSTGAQFYQQATLGADTVLASSAGGAVTFNSTVAGPFALTLNTSGPLTFNGAVGGGGAPALASLTAQGGGEVILMDAGSVTTTGAQSYSGPVHLLQDTLFTSRAAGITFFSNVYGDHALTLSTAGATTFDQPVGASRAADADNDPALSSLTADPGSAVVINGGSVTTRGLQTYGGVLTINGPAGGQTLLTASNNESSANGALRGNVVFAQDVNVNGGSLRVNGDRILAEAGSNIEVAGAGNLDLEASDLIILQGSSYGSASGSVILNDPQTATTATTENRATIYLTGPRTLFHGGSFDLGYLQNLYSLGSVTINVGRGSATLSDIAANNSLTVSAGSIVLRARNPDPARGGPGGGADDGLNFVARNSIDFGNTNIRYDNTHSSNDQANFVTTGGLVTVNRDGAQGISLFQDASLSSEFQQVNNNLNFNDAQFSGFVSPFQPISGGTQTLDTAAALSGALPDQKPLDVAVDITVTASQMEELKKLGIHPRTARKQERVSLTSKRALFAQLVDGQDQDNYGRLQPIKGGVSRLVPSDYVVVVDRMSEREVQQILTAFEDLYGKNKEKVPPIGGAFNAAFTDYTTEKQTADPAGLAPYILSKPGKYPAVDKAVRGFDNLFGYIESLGLTDKEQAKAKEHIASDLEVAGVSPEDMVKVIDTLRSKIPKDQKAPSTKLPSSPPVSAPAPGATNPAPPAKKPDAPLKTAARHPRNDSVRPAVHPSKPTRDDPRHEVAGL